jgi:hydroxymethylglutaryl-CoA reductase
MINQVNLLAENVVSVFPMPYSLAQNFIINNKKITIPYVCPESGVVAAASSAAKLCKPTNGFTASADKQIMLGQIVFSDITDPANFVKQLTSNKKELLRWFDRKIKLMKKNLKTVELKPNIVSTPKETFVSLIIEFDVGDITGPRTIGEICSEVAPKVQLFAPESKVLLALHSDFLTKRLARATAKWNFNEIATKSLTGKEVAERIMKLYEFSKENTHRGVTSNKGVLNGIVAFALATGNDAPMIEATIHSFAMRTGKYQPLVHYCLTKDALVGKIELPLSIGFKGGSTLHPFSKITRDIVHAKSAKDYAKIAACLGLAQNFAAMRAIVTHEMIAGNKKLERKFYEQTMRIPRAIPATAPSTLRNDKTLI